MGNELDKSAFSTALVCIYYYSMTSKNKLNGLISRKIPLLNNKMGVKTTKFTIIGKLFTLEYSRREISTQFNNIQYQFSYGEKQVFSFKKTKLLRYERESIRVSPIFLPLSQTSIICTTYYLYEITKSNSKAEDCEFEFYSLM